MAHPVVWPKKTFFYPIGNTSPYCFTQELAPESNADVLLLACGDPRSILYTIHADLGSYDRKLDFTCCDWEPAILARNILLFTMIADDVDPVNAWSIFYHFFLDQTSYRLLLAQCRALLRTSVDMQTWQASKYGHYLRFCDEHSLMEVRRHWNLYLETDNLSQKEKQELKTSFISGMKSARTKMDPHPDVGPAVGPLIHAFYTEGLSKNVKSYTEFWSTGVTDSNLFKDAINRHLNPTFVYSLAGKIFNVHYGTDPIRAFHLAPGVTSIRGGKSPSKISLTALVELSMSQFSEWCSSFRKRISNSSSNIKIRFFVGESLAFCQALQYCRDSKITDTGVYSYPWGGSQIDFDINDYGSRPLGPMLFNVIDTSNLTDHSGLLNLLIVTIPLLQHMPSSVIYTNTLLPSEDTGPPSSGLPEKACADIPTLSLLLGVSPTSHTSHFTSNSNKHTLMASSSGQFHEPISWKIPSSIVPGLADTTQELRPTALVCDPKKLAQFLFSLYLRMFVDENTAEKFRNMGSITHLRKQELLIYLRESFVSMLQVVKARVGFEWTETINHFLDLVGFDRTLLIGLHSYQELSCQLHLRDLHTMDVLRRDYLESVRSPRDRFRGWNVIPPVVCIVLKVPRRCLKVFEDMEVDEIGTPFLQCESYGSSFHNLHPSFRPIFGDIQVSHGGGETQVVIKEDLKGWNGDSPLIVTFYLPSWILTHEPMTTQIGFHFRSTPSTTRYISKLGMRLAIFSAPLADTEHIQVVRHRPNNVGELARLRSKLVLPISHPDNAVSSQTTLGFDVSGTKATSLTIRDNISDNGSAKSLSNGASVATKPIADCSILVTYEGYDRIFTFPFPVRGNKCKTRIARKSSYIEIECPIRPDFEDFLDLSLNPFPVLRDNRTLNLLNVHYLKLDTLPALHLPIPPKRLQWLSVHLGMTMSERERHLREGKDPKGQETLVNLKGSIGSILLEFSGLDSSRNRPKVVALANPKPGVGVYTLIFVNDIKLDLSAHTVVADACVVPLTESLVSRIGATLGRIWKGGLTQIPTLDEEALAWKKLLPVFVERCRTWQHTETCEYLSKGFPASLEGITESAVCSCGKGKNLGPFGAASEWKELHAEATRIAIGPLFTFSFLEDLAKSEPKNPDSKKPHASASSSSATALRCANCGGPGKPTLSVCSLCKTTKYCSRTCQKSHWKAHKPQCGSSNS